MFQLSSYRQQSRCNQLYTAWSRISSVFLRSSIFHLLCWSGRLSINWWRCNYLRRQWTIYWR